MARLAQDVVDDGVHPLDEMPFLVPWTDGAGQPSFVDDFVAYHVGCRTHWQPDDWHLELGVWADGRLVGVQALFATSFASTRTTSTGSWLTRPHQRRGIGTEMRTAVLALAFDGLDAVASTSGALEGNVASAAVSLRLGYELVGSRVVSPRGVPRREDRFLLTREAWEAHVRPPVEVVGLEPCRGLFGA